MPHRSDDDRSAAQRVFAVADTFEHGDELTLSEVARRSDLPVSTAHRILAEWTAWGGLVRREDGRYRVGLKLWRLGIRQPTARRLREVARPFLDDLLESTGEHVHLAVRDGLGVIYLERFSGPGAVRVISEVGSRLPLHATGVGLVLLAYAPPGTLEEVLAGRPRKFTPYTLTEERELRARLATIRASEIARTVEEMTRGAFSVAAPIRDVGGDVVAAVSIIARSRRVGEPQFPLGVRMAARGISAALGAAT